MTVRVRFFARFRELLGTDIPIEPGPGSLLIDLVRDIAGKNREGYDAIFDEQGRFRDYVIVMKNGRRLEEGAAASSTVADGDEIAIFPPVAGG